jgi:rubrerythrin
VTDALTDRQRNARRTAEESPADLTAADLDALADLAGHDAEETRVDAAEALSHVAGERPDLVVANVSAVLRGFVVDDVNVRTFAMNAVAALAREAPERLGETTAVSNVAQALNDRDEWVRASAAETLGDVGETDPDLVADAGVVRSLARRVESEAFPDARAQMARSLGRIGRATPELIDDCVESRLERLAEADDEIERSAQAAVDAIAEGRAETAGTESDRGEAAAFCPQCGTEIETDPAPNFCRNCGHEL